MISKEVAVCRGRVAGLKRAVRNGERPEHDPALDEAHRDLAVALIVAERDRLAQKARALVDAWPDLDEAQLGRIASVLHGAGG